MTTRVVNVRKFGGYFALQKAIEEGTAVYIGRAMPRQGLKASPWGNPFRIGYDGDRRQVINLYAEWVHRQPELLSKLQELKDKELVCWCFPQECHGDVLVDIVEALAAADVVS